MTKRKERGGRFEITMRCDCRHVVIVSLTTLSGFDRVSQGLLGNERPGHFTEVKVTTY